VTGAATLTTDTPDMPVTAAAPGTTGAAAAGGPRAGGAVSGGCVEYRHTVAFAETGLDGTADYVSFLKWQQRCRQQFLRSLTPAHPPPGHRAHPSPFTVRVDCELLGEVRAMERLSIRMRTVECGPGRFELLFDYLKHTDDAGGPVLVARGRQRIECRRGRAPAPAAVRRPPHRRP
jgi:enediyne biosynthesis thioesterase